MKKIITILVFIIALPTLSNRAHAIFIDFENLNTGDSVSNQYFSDGVVFSSTINSPFASPGQIVIDGYNSENALKATSKDNGIFMHFDVPVYSIDAWIYEFEGSIGERTGTVMFDFDATDEEELTVTEGETVYILRDDGEWLFVRNESGATGYIPTSYVQTSVYLEIFEYNENSELTKLLFDEPNVTHTTNKWSSLSYSSNKSIAAIQLWGTKDFKVDDITVGVRAIPIPEPATLLLFASGIAGMFRFRSNKRQHPNSSS